jgi:hypothetical protein
MKKHFVFAFVFVLFAASTVFAAVNIGEYTGNIKITMPDGKIVMVTPDKPLPEIPDAATITVLTGTAQIKVTGKSTATVLVGGNQLTLRGGDAVRVTMATTASGTGDLVVNYQTGNIVVESGAPIMQLITGSSATLNDLKAEPYRPRAPQAIPTTELRREEHSNDISGVIPH